MLTSSSSSCTNQGVGPLVGALAVKLKKALPFTCDAEEHITSSTRELCFWVTILVSAFHTFVFIVDCTQREVTAASSCILGWNLYWCSFLLCGSWCHAFSLRIRGHVYSLHLSCCSRTFYDQAYPWIYSSQVNEVEENSDRLLLGPHRNTTEWEHCHSNPLYPLMCCRQKWI